MKIYEQKYLSKPSNRMLLASNLNHYMLVPKKFASAHLRTFYFDDSKLSSFYESANGHYNKIKCRFREYINPEESGAYYSLEVKIRNGISTDKIKHLIYSKLPKAYRIRSFNSLVRELSNITGESYSDIKNVLNNKTYKPTCIVEYRRQRFDDKYKSIRYNIDTDIIAKRTSGFALLGKSHLLEKKYINDIFEMKSMSVPIFPRSLRKTRVIRSSFSKYLWAMTVLDNTNRVHLL